MDTKDAINDVIMHGDVTEKHRDLLASDSEDNGPISVSGDVTAQRLVQQEIRSRSRSSEERARTPVDYNNEYEQEEEEESEEISRSLDSGSKILHEMTKSGRPILNKVISMETDDSPITLTVTSATPELEHEMRLPNISGHNISTTQSSNRKNHQGRFKPKLKKIEGAKKTPRNEPPHTLQILGPSNSVYSSNKPKQQHDNQETHVKHKQLTSPEKAVSQKIHHEELSSKQSEDNEDKHEKTLEHRDSFNNKQDGGQHEKKDDIKSEKRERSRHKSNNSTTKNDRSPEKNMADKSTHDRSPETAVSPAKVIKSKDVKHVVKVDAPTRASGNDSPRRRAPPAFARGKGAGGKARAPAAQPRAPGAKAQKETARNERKTPEKQIRTNSKELQVPVEDVGQYSDDFDESSDEGIFFHFQDKLYAKYYVNLNCKSA